MLVFCTCFSGLNILWWSAHGWSSFVAAICTGLAIHGVLAPEKPCPASKMRAAVLAAASALLHIWVTVLLLMEIYSSATWANIDPMHMDVLFGELADNKMSVPEELLPGVPYSPEALVAFLERSQIIESRPRMQAAHIIFTLYFVFTAGIAAALSATCARLCMLMRELR
uniref:Uncharacterized protein n=1 Tax=Haptolina brevifila TaxID=156173 RepID=A0A7S2G4Y2_9EUKA|mmetsp:Transcript_26038/g.52207  ORF Transcript_26038/g.52207 Transcript_26038/m.52207 type:complete len:169 (+) Transcript_26038:737-1243(+)